MDKPNVSEGSNAVRQLSAHSRFEADGLLSIRLDRLVCIGFLAGVALAFGTNPTNNLPLGLMAGAFTTSAELPQKVVDAVLVGIDLGPNLSVTGSLATILWLTALKREGIDFGAWRFLKLGLVVMPPALALALLAVLFQPWG